MPEPGRAAAAPPRLDLHRCSRNRPPAPPQRAAERGFIDDIIQPKDTRRRLCEDLEALRGKRHEVRAEKKHGLCPL